MSEKKKPVVMSFDVDGLCDPATGVCAWPPPQSTAGTDSADEPAEDARLADG